MYINPKTAIAEGWITHPKYKTIQDWENGKHVQPNAIDFTLATIHQFVDANDNMWLSETHKVMRKLAPVEAASYSNQGKFFKIPGNSVADFSSEMHCKLPQGVAAVLIIRSTLNRNGIFLTSGLYDSGFEGPCAGTLHNRGPAAYIAPGTRIGQIKFVRSEDSGVLYAGGYNVKQGEHWSNAVV